MRKLVTKVQTLFMNGWGVHSDVIHVRSTESAIMRSGYVRMCGWAVISQTRIFGTGVHGLDVSRVV